MHYFFLSLLAVLLAACNSGTSFFKDDEADPREIVEQAPLDMPPDFMLHPPLKGEAVKAAPLPAANLLPKATPVSFQKHPAPKPLPTVSKPGPLKTDIPATVQPAENTFMQHLAKNPLAPQPKDEMKMGLPKEQLQKVQSLNEYADSNAFPALSPEGVPPSAYYSPGRPGCVGMSCTIRSPHAPYISALKKSETLEKAGTI